MLTSVHYSSNILTRVTQLGVKCLACECVCVCWVLQGVRVRQGVNKGDDVLQVRVCARMQTCECDATSLQNTP